jgi:plastocyanin
MTRPPRLRTLPLAAVAIAALLALAGCGSNNNKSSGSASSSAATSQASSSAGGGETLKLSADPGGALKFDKSSLSAKAGTVTLEMANPSSVPHAVAVEGNGVDQAGETVTKDGTSKVTVTLKAGSYTFYCPVDGHKAAGMEGKLTVS